VRPTLSSHELRSSTHSLDISSFTAVTGGRGTVVALVDSTGKRLNGRSDVGIHCDGDGARRRLFADALGCSDGDVVDSSRVRLFGRESESDDAGTTPEVAEASAGETDVSSCDVPAESLDVIWFVRFAVFTGLRMHRLTWRLRLDATPKRRPQVSHTNAFSPVCTSKCFLNVEGLSKDFSHIQQACFFSRGLGPEPSVLVLRDAADLEELAHAVRMDCVISAGVVEGPGNARAGGRGGDEWD
jgi:hypothetical protein